MGKRHEAVVLLKMGCSPGQIRRRQGVTLSTILGYLDEMVGKGYIRRSDILFSLPSEARDAVFAVMEKVSSDKHAICSTLRDQGLKTDPDDVEVALRYSDERFALGDIYEDVRAIEVDLHRLIRTALEEEYGQDDGGWWRQAIPLPIRQKCQSRREEDHEPLADPYGYTDLIDLRSILEKQWTVIAKRLPGDVASNKKQLSEELLKLNQIRRVVMHPTRGAVPTERDFDFVRALKFRLGFMDELDAAFHQIRQAGQEEETHSHESAGAEDVRQVDDLDDLLAELSSRESAVEKDVRQDRLSQKD